MIDTTNDFLYPMIKKIQNVRSPGMYLGKVSLHSLQLFLDGYEWAQHDISGQEFGLLKNFNFYVAEYFDGSPNQGWANIILQNTDNEIEAFNKFYELFDAYYETLS